MLALSVQGSSFFVTVDSLTAKSWKTYHKRRVATPSDEDTYLTLTKYEQSIITRSSSDWFPILPVDAVRANQIDVKLQHYLVIIDVLPKTKICL